MDQLKVHLVGNGSGQASLEFWVNDRPLVDWIDSERSRPLSTSPYSLVGTENVDELLRETGPWVIGDDLPSESWRFEDPDEQTYRANVHRR
jgi:hypothetical protein